MMEEIENLPEEEKEKEILLQLPNSYFERGVKKGRQEGMEVGMKEGKLEGIEEGKKEVILKLIEKGMSISEIADITEYSQEEIKKFADK